MRRLVMLLLIFGLFAGCGPRKLSPTEVATEKKAIESVVTAFWSGYESKNPPALTNLITNSSDLIFFGTDSAEVITTPTQWEADKKMDLELFDSITFGSLRNVSVQLSDDGTLGTILCETPVDMTVGGEQSHSIFRIASAVRKENGAWKIVHGMAAFATVGQSSVELVMKMKAEKTMSTKAKK